MANGDTKTEALLNILGNGGDSSAYRGCCNTKTQSYILDAIDRVESVEEEVEELKNNPDVVDIVDTYADLQAYDTSSLTDKDIIRVLEDSTHNNKSTYYRWTASTSSWVYIGEAGGSVNVVQNPGTSTTDVMSQDATTKLIYSDYGTAVTNHIVVGTGTTTSASYQPSITIGHATTKGNSPIAIGYGTRAEKNYNIAIGYNAVGYNGTDEIAIGNQCGSLSPVSNNNISIGHNTRAQGAHSVAIGSGATTSQQGEFAIDCGPGSTNGYNNSQYRLLTGVYDPQSAHDAATKGYVDSVAGGGTTTQIYADPLLWNDEPGLAPYTKSIETAWPLGPIPANATFELINDNPVAFATYGFAILSVNTSTNMIKIISIGAPDTGVNLTVSMK